MIALHDISVAFGSRQVLHSISIAVPQGGVTAVMGPNGCGKTTLLRCIGGLLRPSSGSAELCGRNVMQYSARQLAQKVAFVRQHPHADFDFTAYEVVMMGRNPYQSHLQAESAYDAQVVEQSMRQTGTWHLRDARPTQLSGGELQRVMIARALAQQTPLLLMDEPVSNLDIKHQIEVMQLLQQSARTVLIVIHDLNLALHYCQNLLLMQQGRLLYYGNMQQGLTPQHIQAVYGTTARVENGHVMLDYGATATMPQS